MGNVIGHIVYDGVDSRDFGVIVSSVGTHRAPKRVVENIEIPGRNGTLTIDGGRFENITISYVGMILKNFPDNFDAFKAFLLSKAGYKRLEDSFSPDYFRLAKVYEEIDPAVVTWDAAGKFEIPFDCDPRRFLKSGEDKVYFEREEHSVTDVVGELYNPTYFDAKPLLLVESAGTIRLGDKSITITTVPAQGYAYIDLETLNAYNGSRSLNEYVTIDKDTVLKPGKTVVTLIDMDTLIVIPRWWTV